MTHSETRIDGREQNELRPVVMTTDYVDYPEGSVLIEMGKTRVLCNVSLQDKVPDWLAGKGRGWLTAEYAMLPRATHTRTPRETKGLKGRTQEIRRLIGRSLRMALDLEALGERMVTVDCDVIQADGGTRTASITGAYVALVLALRGLINSGELPETLLKSPVAAISIGIVNNEPYLDLCYQEDSQADVDFNVVMDGEGRFIEVQGTAEGAPFDRETLDRLLDMARDGVQELLNIQRTVLDN